MSYLQGTKRNDDDIGILEAESNLNYEAITNQATDIAQVQDESAPGTSKEPTPKRSLNLKNNCN